MDREELIKKVTPILEKYPVTKASFFGSYARNTQDSESDVDIIVKFSIPNVGLTFFSLREDLTQVLPMPLDLVYSEGLSCMEHSFQENINKEELMFYEKNIGANT